MELVLHEVGVEPDLHVLEPVQVVVVVVVVVVVHLQYQVFLMNSELSWI